MIKKCGKIISNGDDKMIKLLIKKFIPDYENVTDKKVRENYTVMAGVLGIICNFLLFCVKVLIGTMVNSIAIISDGFNNLSDMGSSLVGIIGAKLSNLRPDKEHPFGHGRLEYIASLIVSLIIILVGFELFKTSGQKMFSSEKVSFNPVLIAILVLSVFVKVWMFSYNRYMGKKINSTILEATSKDSLNDVFATGAVIISTIIGFFVSFPIDAIAGLLVSVFIVYSGFDMAKETITLLLGNPPDKKTVDEISQIILSGEGIIGIHDLIVHDYGPGRRMASVHAEVMADDDIIKIHEEIDRLEQLVFNEMGIMTVIHMDPICTNCTRTNMFKEMVEEIVAETDSSLSIHDFRITDGDNRINLIFDIVMPCDYTDEKRKEITDKISEKIIQKDEKCRAVMHIDNKY